MDLHINETFYLNHETRKCMGRRALKEMLHKGGRKTHHLDF